MKRKMTGHISGRISCLESVLVLLTGALLIGSIASCNKQVCAPGSTQKCDCPPGQAGVKICEKTGERYTECLCQKVATTPEEQKKKEEEERQKKEATELLIPEDAIELSRQPFKEILAPVRGMKDEKEAEADFFFGFDARCTVAWLAMHQKIALYDVQTGRLIESHDVQNRKPYSVAVTDGYILVTGQNDNAGLLLKRPGGEIAAEVIEGIAWEGAQTNRQGTIGVFYGMNFAVVDLKTAQTLWTEKDLAGKEYIARGLDVSPNGRFIAVLDSQDIVWDVQSKSIVMRTPEVYRYGRYGAIRFHPDGKTFFESLGDGKIQQWSLETKQKVLTILGHEAPVLSIDFSPDGTLMASTAPDRKLILWYLGAQSLKELELEKQANQVCFVDNDRLVLLNHTGTLMPYKINRQHEVFLAAVEKARTKKPDEKKEPETQTVSKTEEKTLKQAPCPTREEIRKALGECEEKFSAQKCVTAEFREAEYWKDMMPTVKNVLGMTLIDGSCNEIRIYFLMEGKERSIKMKREDNRWKINQG